MFGFFSSKNSSDPKQSAEVTLREFINVGSRLYLDLNTFFLTILSQKAPKNTYTFDSERGAPDSQICREPGGGMKKECIQVSIITGHSTLH